MTDFGLAEVLKGETNQGRVSGTQGYLAPEILDGRPYGTASDIWSLGCLLYVMLDVNLPFKKELK